MVLIGAPEIKLVVGAEAHPTLFKSLGLLGLGRNKVIRVPVDGQGRMRQDALPTLSSNTIVCTQAGNVNTGAFDPIQEICRRAHDAGAWVHVDGAFGLWACAAPSRAYLTNGAGRGGFLGHGRSQMVECAIRFWVSFCPRRGSVAGGNGSNSRIFANRHGAPKPFRVHA